MKYGIDVILQFCLHEVLSTDHGQQGGEFI